MPPRSQVRTVPRAVHGAPDHAELQRLELRPADVLDFSSPINAYGPSPSVREAVARTPLDRYPDDEALALRAALAERLGVPPTRILAANGCSELIWLAALAFLHPCDRVLILGPTFAEYARMAALMDAHLRTHLASEENAFAPSLDEVNDDLDRWQPQLVFLCNPNNPTGAGLDARIVASWTQDYQNTIFIVDESYLAFAAGLESMVSFAGGNVLVLKSMTKEFALAGLRLGYAVGAEEAIASLARVRPPWSVNALAQAAGIAALRDREHLNDSLQRLAAAKSELTAAIAALGMQVLPSAAPFFLVRVADAAAVRLALLRKGVLVRDCASFGLPQYVRICTRRPEENARLVAALRQLHGEAAVLTRLPDLSHLEGGGGCRLKR
ncbi:MAG TPA: histidinol-phosphate transaminase [Gemmataceae bacterium]|nr:histidinol-phosphate transaminase [Gemmataceae bacterium]